MSGKPRPPLTRNALLMRVASEMGDLSRIVPSNPMDIKELAARSRVVESRLRALSMVVSSIVPGPSGEGMDLARELWADYESRYRAEDGTR